MMKLVVLVIIVYSTAGLPTTKTATNLSSSSRIVGGSTVADGAYPFIVSLRSSANVHLCGGSILNNEFILTAAHCLVSYSASEINIVVGTNSLDSGGTTIAANRLIVHADFDLSKRPYDIGVIQLSGSITYSSGIAQVSLNTADIGVVSAILIGWGRTSTEGILANELQEIATSTISFSDCEAVWGSRVSESNICAFSRAGEGACNGDSGGPLLQASDLTQIGIVSFSIACAQGYPDVYTRVSWYSSWIQTAIAS
ncbi:polyserase-related [Holotrichia oblita]|uniref:Polyserase-related n=1 Tax=Holotrichia oblita TaxID=644536 RepID=A0ACB9TSG0_HOLOL|nr:polyserase-related [Holotrichia oblita]